jgi:hypothetical protein
MNITSKYNINDVVKYIHEHGGRDEQSEYRYGEIIEIAVAASGMKYVVHYESGKFPDKIDESDIIDLYKKYGE